jgi:hypothetical protein
MENLARNLSFTSKLFSKVETGATGNVRLTVQPHLVHQPCLAYKSKPKLAQCQLLGYSDLANPAMRSVGKASVSGRGE